jgi:hypothetical protein
MQLAKSLKLTLGVLFTTALAVCVLAAPMAGTLDIY